MSFEKRRDAAVKELKDSAIWRSNAMPPLLLALWRFGVKARPPHYNSFIKNAGVLGLWFAIVWGLLMWVIEWGSSGYPVTVAIVIAIMAGILFGVLMGVYYKWSARRNRLSKWEDLALKEDVSE